MMMLNLRRLLAAAVMTALSLPALAAGPTMDAATEASLPTLATLLGRALGVVGPRTG